MSANGIREGTASGVVITRSHDGTIQLVATLMPDDYPELDHFEHRLLREEVAQPADHLQSMEILMRRAHEQGKLK